MFKRVAQCLLPVLAFTLALTLPIERVQGHGNGAKAYDSSNVSLAERNKSIGDPRGVTFDPTGARVYVSGMGSNNVVVLNSTTGARLGGVGHSVEVGFGPTGLAHHSAHDVLYVVN